jgi:hypothetical protein
MIRCATALAAAMLVAACGKQGVELGQGGSVVSGSAGPAVPRARRKELARCEAPVAVVSLVENQHGYVGIGRGGLPPSPLPLVRVLMQQSGCFRIVDRGAGLRRHGARAGTPGQGRAAQGRSTCQRAAASSRSTAWCPA